MLIHYINQNFHLLSKIESYAVTKRSAAGPDLVEIQNIERDVDSVPPRLLAGISMHDIP